MKKIILLLLISFSGLAQETQFHYTQEKGLTDYIIISCEGKSKEELYNKTINWISVYYNNPKEVIKAEIKDDYIRIEGIQKNVPLGTFMGMETGDNLKYQIEISVKDNKYKLDVINIETYIIPSQYIVNSGWVPFEFNNTINQYKNGKIKNSVKYLPKSLPQVFNDINTDLYKYILSNESTTKKNEW
jgi:hypothetical protein